ncbi:hypothetical protein GCM10009733_052860 [Nonomuraea maheshkhaliensis]|uniref:Uncharacterized protein n=1 Tax=Nonomuraea maheshkhaliensis TaxID=419590 RepID=A0ABP4REN6_9ACTN
MHRALDGDGEHGQSQQVAHRTPLGHAAHSLTLLLVCEYTAASIYSARAVRGSAYGMGGGQE